MTPDISRAARLRHTTEYLLVPEKRQRRLPDLPHRHDVEVRNPLLLLENTVLNLSRVGQLLPRRRVVARQTRTCFRAHLLQRWQELHQLRHLVRVLGEARPVDAQRDDVEVPKQVIWPEALNRQSDEAVNASQSAGRGPRE